MCIFTAKKYHFYGIFAQLQHFTKTTKEVNMADYKSFIQQVKQANDIVDVVGSYIELRPRGTNHMARCPFHGEKTPSFNVNRNMQIFKCFGCGESGDVITFVEKIESCSTWEAVEILAKRANIPMPETPSQREDKQFAARKKQKDLHLEICRETAVFYFKAYRSEKGKKARDYFEGRGFSADTAKKFGIGYSPDSYSLPNYLLGKGFSEEECLKAGVIQKSKNGRLIDALGRRLIVPIFNMQGKVIAFGGRALEEQDLNFGKYKNTSDTPLFTKKNNLFALNIAKEQKQQSALKHLVVVEGYMDVIAMYQAGFKTTVASMGTSLTAEQARWLSRLTDTVYICYDGDSAGQKATVRGMDILDEAGLEVRVMSVPNNQDPDEYIKAHGRDAFEKLIEQAMPLPDYKIQLLDNSFDITSSDPAVRNNAMPKYVKGAIIMLRQLDENRQRHYISVLSAKTGYSTDYFMRKIAEKGSDSQTDEPTPMDNAMSPETKAKFFVASCLLHSQDYASLDEKPRCDTLFLSNLYNYLFDCKQKGEQPTVDMLYTICPNATQDEYDQIIDVDFSPKRYAKNAQYFAECKRVILVEELQKEKNKLLAQMKKDPTNVELLHKLAEISAKITSI